MAVFVVVRLALEVVARVWLWLWLQLVCLQRLWLLWCGGASNPWGSHAVVAVVVAVGGEVVVVVVVVSASSP